MRQMSFAALWVMRIRSARHTLWPAQLIERFCVLKTDHFNMCLVVTLCIIECGRWKYVNRSDPAETSAYDNNVSRQARKISDTIKHHTHCHRERCRSVLFTVYYIYSYNSRIISMRMFYYIYIYVDGIFVFFLVIIPKFQQCKSSICLFLLFLDRARC